MPERDSLVIALAPDSEFAARLAEAGSSGAPLLVDAGGLLYRLEVHPAGGAVPSSGQATGEASASMSLPDEFFGRLTAREDVREILKRLAE